MHRRGYVFAALGAAFGAGAIIHLVALLDPSFAPDASPARHALFLGINLVCVAGFRWRPWYFLPALTILAVQQGTTHGVSVVEHARRGAIAWSDLAVMLVFAVGIGALAWERIEDIQARRRGARDRAPTSDLELPASRGSAKNEPRNTTPHRGDET